MTIPAAAQAVIDDEVGPDLGGCVTAAITDAGYSVISTAQLAELERVEGLYADLVSAYRTRGESRP